jgi:hypothetical protein
MYLQLFIIGFIIIFYLSHFTIPQTHIIDRLQKDNILPKVIPTIQFYTKDETKNFILNDRDKFMVKLDKVNYIARGVNSADEYITITSKAATNFSDDEKYKLVKAIDYACDKLDNLDKRSLKKYGIVKKNLWDLIKNWKLSKTNDKVLEMGMPHTRENIIFISGYYLANNNDIKKIAKTMIHEMLHIYQRTYRSEYIQFLKDHQWEIHPYNGNDKRINPDLDDIVWKRPVQKGESGTKATRLEAGGYKIYIALFNSRKPKNLKDINIKNPSDEHPYEYYAYKLSEEIMK